MRAGTGHGAQGTERARYAWKRYAITVFVLLASHVPILSAQQWDSPRARELAQRAVMRRAGQIADTTIASYTAKAKGYLTFLAQVGDTSILPAFVMKQSQIAVNVYWKAPNSSKQIVVGLRDTSLIPGDIGYYTDRYGIVQSNFPERIRLGDGRDVRDVLHPLSAAGFPEYEYAIVDSLVYQPSGSARIDVYQLMYRPKDPRQPRGIGSAFIDVRNADIVRLDLTFTRSSILDKRIELLSVSLENALIEGRAWLPRRQQLEVVRTGTKFSIEMRGIIRGRWEVDDYDITFNPPVSLFAGAPIAFVPPAQLKAYPFEGKILDGLPPDVAVMRDGDLERIQKQAEDLVKLEYRERVQRASVTLPRTSDALRINRAEGVAAGAAFRFHPFTGIDIDTRVRYGFSDEEWKGEVGLRFQLPRDRAIRLFARRDYDDTRGVPEGSMARNSIASQEFGSDYTDPFDVRAAGVQFTLGRFVHARWRLDVTAEKHDAVSVHATSERGRYEPTIPAWKLGGARADLRGEGAVFGVAGGSLRIGGDLRVAKYDNDAGISGPFDVRLFRGSVDAEYQRPVGGGTLFMRTTAAALSGGELPYQTFVYFGGPVTAPGYQFDAFAARRGVSQRIEWRTDVPFFGISLARFGATPKRAQLAPYVHAVYVDDPVRFPAFPAPDVPMPPGSAPAQFLRGQRQGWYPAVGLGLEPLMGLIRFDVARGLRDGRWTFSVDLARMFWPAL